MAKNNVINGVRVFRRWSVPHVFLFIFSLGVIAIPVCMFFIGFMFKGDNVTQSFGILEMLSKLFNTNLGADEARMNNLNAFLTVIGETLKVNSGNQFMDVIANVISYFFLASPLLTVIPAIIAIFYFFFGLSGRYKHPAGLKAASIMQFIFTTLAVTVPIIFGIIGSPSVPGGFGIIYLIIYASASLVFMIFICAFKHAGYTGKMWYKDAEELPPVTPANPYMNQANMYPQFVGQPQPIIIQQPAPNPVVVNTSAPEAPKAQEPVVEKKVITEIKREVSHGLPPELSSIGGHAFSQNANLEIATIPQGIKEIGPSAFSNCPNLKVVSIPLSVMKIGYNAFFNCRRLVRINYAGKKQDWKNIVRGSNWLTNAGTSIVVCSDGTITVNPFH